MNPYAGLSANYDDLTGDVDYGAYLRFYQSIFHQSGTEVSSVLDLGCGTGTLTLLMDGQGYDMTGVDAEAGMLSAAMEKAVEAGRGGAILLLQQKMQDLDLYGTVDAAISSLDCLNYVEPESLNEVFRRLRLFIRPGGLLIFDILTEESLRALDGQVYCDEQEGLFCVWRGSYDEKAACCRYYLDDFAETEDGAYQRFSEEHVEYVHPDSRLRKLLAGNGFCDIRVISGKEAVGDERRAFYIAERGK